MSNISTATANWLPMCLPMIWCWVALTLSVFAYFGAFTVRYFGGKWESMRVIEKNLQKHEIA